MTFRDELHLEPMTLNETKVETNGADGMKRVKWVKLIGASKPPVVDVVVDVVVVDVGGLRMGTGIFFFYFFLSFFSFFFFW